MVLASDLPGVGGFVDAGAALAAAKI